MGRSTSTKTETSDNFSQLVTNINNQSIDVGATGKLTTTVDSDIVGAINELDSNMGAKTSLTTTVKTSIVNAINEIDSDIGQLSTIADDIRDSNFAISINNLNTNVNQLLGSLSGLDSAGGDSDTRRGGFDVAEQVTVVAALNALSQDIGKLDSDVNREARMTTTATTLRGAIDELDSDIGARPHTTLNTTAKNLVGAINENLASLNALTVFKNFATDSGSISITVDSANDTLKLLSGSSLKTLGLAGTNTIQIDHDVTGASSVNNSGNTFIQDLTINADGHVTGTASGTVAVGNGATTIIGGTGLSGGGTFTANRTDSATITLNNTITNNNQLSNGAGYITSSSLPSVSNSTVTITAGTNLTGGGSFTLNGTGGTITLNNSMTAITNNNQLTNGNNYLGGATVGGTNAMTKAALSADFYPVRASLYWNGSTINGDNGISSVTNHSTGDFTLNFSSTQRNANYAVTATGDGSVNGYHVSAIVCSPSIRTTRTTSAVSIAHLNISNSNERANGNMNAIIVGEEE